MIPVPLGIGYLELVANIAALHVWIVTCTQDIAITVNKGLVLIPEHVLIARHQINTALETHLVRHVPKDTILHRMDVHLVQQMEDVIHVILQLEFAQDASLGLVSMQCNHNVSHVLQTHSASATLQVVQLVFQRIVQHVTPQQASACNVSMALLFNQHMIPIVLHVQRTSSIFHQEYHANLVLEKDAQSVTQ